MGRTVEQWIALAERRILNILRKYRVSYTRHLEIKISEAGPSNQRVEPALLSQAFRKLKKNKMIRILKTEPVEIVGLPDFGKVGDHQKLQRFTRLQEIFSEYSQRQEFCGLLLERLLYEAVLDNQEQFTVIGSGPIYKDNRLIKPPGSELLFFNGNQSYGGAGLDLFLIDNETRIPIGVEAKNIREWIYPASVEVWRMIARACTLECLPVLAARKLSYVTRAGFFSHAGILGFETQFQYFHPSVRAESKYRFKEVIDKDGLGFADIKITKDVPKHFIHFFKNILPEQVYTFFHRFMENRDLLMKYAIDYEMAEDKMSTKDRMELYNEFKDEADFKDPEFQ